MQTPAQEAGRRAETRVCRHLFWRGWRICARNWLGGGGELDVVASRWTTLLVVEVRQRATADAAALSVDRAKLDHTIAAAEALVRSFRLHRYRLRLDLAAVDARGRIHWRRDLLAGLPGW
jgi:Holliday junction resolvase-like predicted endonuclease